MEDLNTKNSIRTQSGVYVNLIDPDPNTININDIAFALSKMPRFGGHLKSNYNVACHSIIASYMVPDEYALEALLHDATEAYLMDVPKPLKQHLPRYKEIESNLHKVICQHFQLDSVFNESIKEADQHLLEKEWEYLMLPDRPILKLEGNHVTERDWFFDIPETHQECMDLFLNRYYLLVSPQLFSLVKLFEDKNPKANRRNSVETVKLLLKMHDMDVDLVRTLISKI